MVFGFWVAISAFGPTRIAAQTNKGAIDGTVTDDSGGVIPGATVTIVNLGTGETFHVTSSDRGTFSFPVLDPVEYRITVELQGFKPAVVKRVKVDTATTASVNVKLEVGALSDEVTVTAERPLLNTSSGTPGQTITERQIVEMPLNNRSVLDLALTAVNVSGAAGTEDPDLGSEIPTPGMNLFINGGRAGSTSILADGARNTGVGLGRAVVTFSPDTVQEFTVQTSNFSAEFGQTGGGVINMTTKSGTNEYRSLASWYHRNPALNAAPFTTATVNRPQSNRRQHQVALTVGGPVRHNRTFFYLAYEPRYYYDASNPQNSLLPTDAMRRGDFSNLVSVLGGYTTRDVAERFGLQWQPVTLYNQFDGVGNQLRRIALGAGQTYPAFPGNRIPANMLDPLAQNLLKYLPTPGDYFLDTDGSLRNYATTNFIENMEQRLTLKVDHHISSRNRLSARYTQVPIRGDRGRADFKVGRDEINTGGTDYSWSRQVLMTDTHTFSSSVVNDLRVNYTFGKFTRNFPPGFDALTGRNFSTEIGLPSLTTGGLPEFVTGGGSIGWSQSQQNENAEHTYNIANTTSWVRRNQTWKFGADLLQQRLKTIPMFGASGGRYEFNRNRTLTSIDGTNNTGTGGTEFAQFLLGVYNQTTLRDSLIPYYYQWNSAAAFVQNDWKVRKDLTVNLGMRYTLQLPRTEKSDRQGAFRPDLAKEYPLPQPVTLPDGRVMTSAIVPPFAYSGRGGRSRYITPIDWNGWEPRLGFAWVPAFGWNSAERLVVRGGYGLSHTTLTGLGRNPSPDFASGTLTYTFNTRVTDPNFVARICCNPPQWVPKSPDEVLSIPADGLLYLDGINVAASAVSPNARVPYVQSWSTSVAYQLPWQMAVEVSYLGSKGSHLFLPPISLNPVPFELSEAYLGRGINPLDNVNDPLGRRDANGNVISFSQGYLGAKYLGFEGLNVMLDASGHSLRHAGAVSVRRQSSTLSYTVNYTYGKGMDDASDSGGVRFTDFNPVRTNGHVTLGAPLSDDWSVSTFDVTHNLAATFLWDLPFGRGRRFVSEPSRLVQSLIGGWSISGNGRIQTGTPLVIVLRDDNRLGIEGNVRAIRPNLVPGVPLLNPLWSRTCPVGQNCEPYFNPAAFMRPPKGTLGNAPRTIDDARWPAQQFFDLSVQKNFAIGSHGKRKLQLRVDAINALNHPVFKFGRDADNGEIFALPNEALISTADFNAWADFNQKPRAGTPAGDALRALADQIVLAGRVPGTTVLQPAFYSVPVPQGFHSANANQFDITTLEGFRLYRLRQAYTPDRWGFLGARSPYTPRFIQVAMKLYF
jgi:Carboxypeptidase regulatory-like domain